MATESKDCPKCGTRIHVDETCPRCAIKPFAPPSGSASWGIVYAGKHYGRKHRILHDTGMLTTVLHEPSGDVLTVPYCDVERETPNGKVSDGDCSLLK